jgi:hypothetical protein
VNMPSGLAANTALLEEMVRLLGEVADDLVFVGGCATGLLVTSVRPDYIRATTDVDVVAQATSIREYHALEKRIAAQGFKHDPEVICRWRFAGLQLDLMPSGTGVLGFRNRWYPLVPAGRGNRRAVRTPKRSHYSTCLGPAISSHQVRGISGSWCRRLRRQPRPGGHRNGDGWAHRAD